MTPLERCTRARSPARLRNPSQPETKFAGWRRGMSWEHISSTRGKGASRAPCCTPWSASSTPLSSVTCKRCIISPSLFPINSPEAKSVCGSNSAYLSLARMAAQLACVADCCGYAILPSKTRAKKCQTRRISRLYRHHTWRAYIYSAQKGRRAGQVQLTRLSSASTPGSGAPRARRPCPRRTAPATSRAAPAPASAGPAAGDACR